MLQCHCTNTIRERSRRVNAEVKKSLPSDMGNEMSQRPEVFLSAHELPTQPELNFRPNTGSRIGSSTVQSALALLEYLAQPNNGSASPPNYAQTLKYTDYQNKILAFLSNSNELEKSLIHFGINKINAKKVAEKLHEHLENLKTARENIRLEAGLSEWELESYTASAIDACRNILHLFEDTNGQLRRAPLPASELLINFAAIYAETVIRCASALPSQKQTLDSCMTGLLKRLRSYEKTCIPARMAKVKCHGSWKKEMEMRPWRLNDTITGEKEMLRFAGPPPIWEGFGVIPSVHLGDDWPTSVKGLAGKTVIETWKWNGQGDMKEAIHRTCHYRSQVQIVYTQCFDRAIQGVEEIARRMV